MATTKNITLKLLIDKEKNTLVYAEASKDFVDFLLFLLALPVATLFNLLASKITTGSIGNIYSSVENLKENYLKPTVEKNHLLNPKISKPSSTPLLITSSSTGYHNKFYTCSYPCGKNVVTDIYSGAKCPNCSKWMDQEMKYVAPTNPKPPAAPTNESKEDSEGYVKEAVAYMVFDDLTVTPMTSIAMISTLNKFDISNVNVLKEKEVIIGTEEGLELLRCSFQSSTVLSDLFLRKKKGKIFG